MNRWLLALSAVTLIALTLGSKVEGDNGSESMDGQKVICSCKNDGGCQSGPCICAPGTSGPNCKNNDGILCYNTDKTSGDCGNNGCTVPSGSTSSYCATKDNLQCRGFICKSGLLCRTLDRANRTINCTCASGFHGYQCKSASDADPCPKSRCPNGGKCMIDSNDLLTLSCACPSGYTDSSCTTLASTCPRLDTCPTFNLARLLSNSTDWKSNCQQMRDHVKCFQNAACNLPDVNGEVFRLQLLQVKCCPSTTAFTSCIGTTIECTRSDINKALLTKCGASLDVNAFNTATLKTLPALCKKLATTMDCTRQAISSCTKESTNGVLDTADGIYQDCCFGQPSTSCPANLTVEAIASTTASVASSTMTTRTPITRPPPANVCKPNPCLNNGVCTRQISGTGFTCDCKTGFNGVRCELETDACRSAPCVKNATCGNLGNSFRCICANGFNGTKCNNQYFKCKAAGTFDDSEWCDYFYQCSAKGAKPKRVSCRTPLQSKTVKKTKKETTTAKPTLTTTKTLTPPPTMLYDTVAKRCRPESDFTQPKSKARMTQGCKYK